MTKIVPGPRWRSLYNYSTIVYTVYSLISYILFDKLFFLQIKENYLQLWSHFRKYIQNCRLSSNGNPGL